LDHHPHLVWMRNGLHRGAALGGAADRTDRRDIRDVTAERPQHRDGRCDDQQRYRRGARELVVHACERPRGVLDDQPDRDDQRERHAEPDQQPDEHPRDRAQRLPDPADRVLLPVRLLVMISAPRVHVPNLHGASRGGWRNAGPPWTSSHSPTSKEPSPMPCTTLLVGRRASADGSPLVARTEDSSAGTFAPKRVVVVQPDEQPRTYTSVIGQRTISLPEDPLRYTAIPNALPDEGIWGCAGINAANVAMSATE